MKKIVLKVVGDRILVAPDPVEEKIGEIVIVQDEKLARAGVQIGTVLGVGSECWSDFAGKPWCEPGDRILYSKYAVKFIEHPETNELLGVINDRDVITIVEESEDE